MYTTDNLIKMRKENKLTIYQMANKLGISSSYYSQIENKKRRLSYDMAIKIANIFSKNPDEIFIKSQQ